MAFRIQIRRDTASKWTINNPILLNGEMGYETDTTYLKFGDGTTEWNNLPYWQGGLTGSGLIVKNNGVTVQFPTSNLNFSTDFLVTNSANNTANVSVSGSIGSGISVYDSGSLVKSGATGINFTNSPGAVTVTGNVVNVDLSGGLTVPYYSMLLSLSGGVPSSIVSSKGPDGNPLTGAPWNFVLSYSGSSVTVTHNTGNKVISLSTFGTNSSNVWVRQPVGSSVGSFSLSSATDDNSFVVYGINSSNTGASITGTVEIVWTFTY